MVKLTNEAHQIRLVTAMFMKGAESRINLEREEESYDQCSEIKSADQLRGNCGFGV